MADGLSDSELHRYVDKLLLKPVNLESSNPDTDGEELKRHGAEVNEPPTSDRADRHERKDRPAGAKRHPNTGKPPWKA